MNNKKRILLLVPVFTLLSIICNGQQSGTLIFRITGIETSEGVAIVNLFRAQDDLPKMPFKTLCASIQNCVASVSFAGIPTGDYAAIAYHDKNSNGTLDHRMGFPNEPMGFSNNWNLSLFSGMPTFNKLKFRFNSGNAVVEIAVD